MNWMRRIEYVKAGVFLTLLFGIIILLGDRRPVVMAISVNFADKAVLAGGLARVVWVVEERRHGCAGRVYPLWVDSEGTVFDEPPDAVPARSDPVHRMTVSRWRKVPDGMAPGMATVSPKAVRWCNVLQEYIWPIEEELPKARVDVLSRGG